MRLAALTVVALVLPTAGVAGAGAGSGLYGVVREGPVTPVCRVGVPCTKPAAGIALTFVGQSGSQWHATSKANGSYRVVLQAGTYRVRVGGSTTTRIGSTVKPAVVTVTGGFTRQNFVIDTGIR
jgi:hypothetical protein